MVSAPSPGPTCGTAPSVEGVAGGSSLAPGAQPATPARTAAMPAVTAAVRANAETRFGARSSVMVGGSSVSRDINTEKSAATGLPARAPSAREADAQPIQNP